MPRETRIVAAIVRVAERLGWLTIKIHGGAMQRSGLPDVLCLKDGRAVWLEVKQPGLGKKSDPTPIQLRRMNELSVIGGCRCRCVRSAAEAEDTLLGAAGMPLPRRAVDPQAARCERRGVGRASVCRA